MQNTKREGIESLKHQKYNSTLRVFRFLTLRMWTEEEKQKEKEEDVEEREKESERAID